jgi:hypothetical protein
MSAASVRSSTSVPDPESGNYCGVTVGAESDFLRWAEHVDLVAEGPMRASHRTKPMSS